MARHVFDEMQQCNFSAIVTLCNKNMRGLVFPSQDRVYPSHFQARWLHQLRMTMVGIVKDIWESMLEEVDFCKEATNIESFARYLEAMGLTRQATAPKVYHHCSSRRVLTMDGGVQIYNGFWSCNLELEGN